MSSPARNFPSLTVILIAVGAGLLTLLPPYTIGTGSSALAVQSLEHWMSGTPDTFEALHIHWLWIPRVIAFITGDAFSALVVFRFMLVAATAWLFQQIAARMFGDRKATIGVAMLLLNVTLFFVLHSFSTGLLTLFVAVLMLYLLSSENVIHHRLAALIWGLSLSIGFWIPVLLMAIVTVGLNVHLSVYTLRAKQTLIFFGLAFIGLASYVLLEILYFGTSHLLAALNPKFYPPREISLIAQGIIIALYSANVFFWLVFRRKPTSYARNFQSAFVILGFFYLLAYLFSREDLISGVAVLVPCLALVALDKIESIERFGAIYLAVNLGLFFLLPSVRTDPEIASAKLRRVKSNDEISFSYYRSADIFSYAQLREENAGEEEVRSLLQQARLDSTIVLVNPSTDEWFDAGTLGAMFPDRKFGWFYGTPINMIRVNGLKDTAFINRWPSAPYLAGLFEKSYARRFIDSLLPPNVPIRESERFQFIDCRGNTKARAALIDQLIALGYQGFHHGG